MKIAVVMTYYNRPYQLANTLNSICPTIEKDFFVVVVDDASDEIYNPVLVEGNEYEYPMIFVRIPKEEKTWTNPCVTINIGIKRALMENPDAIVIQNAECFHAEDILKFVSENLTDENYISFPCYSLDKENTFKATDHEFDLEKIISENNVAATANGQNAWYNHKTLRPCAYDFCAAITTKNLLKLNGYDERFKDGVAMADEDFIRRIKLLGLEVIIPDEPICVHQWHYEGADPYDNKEGFQRNQDILKQLKESKNVRAEHIITPNFS